jgi:hypothetical protein
MESRLVSSSFSFRALNAFKASIALLLWATPLALTACGGSNGNGVFQTANDDAGSLGSQMDGSLLPTDAGSLAQDTGPTSCTPANEAAFKPTWNPPLAFKSGACTDLQISSFYDACLGPSSNPGGCAAYVQANTSCAACLQTDDTAPQYGPVIWHANRTYYTPNIAGCIANEQGDAGAGSCGAAYQASVKCKEAACVACATSADPSAYPTCENGADGTGCQALIAPLNTACGTALSSSPVSVCIPPHTDTAEDAYLQLAPIFCGQ